MCRGQQRDRCDWNKDTQSQGLAERGRPTTASLRSHSRIWYLTRRKTSVLWNHQRSPLLRVGTLLPLCCFIDPTVANGERGRGCPFLLNKKRKLKPRERRQLVIQQNPWGKGQGTEACSPRTWLLPVSGLLCLPLQPTKFPDFRWPCEQRKL